MYQLLVVAIAIFGIRLWIAPMNKIQMPIALPKSFRKPKLKFGELQLIALLTAFRQELTAGIPANQAIENVVRDQPSEFFANCKSDLAATSDLLGALGQDAKQLESTSLEQLVKILNINRASGAPITRALDMMIKSALIRHERTQQISAELSGVRATITVLALLPLLGAFLGMMIGVNVPYWLLSNRLGWLCLTLGLTLEGLGLCWVRKLIRGVS
jgi:tight adherence protein B